MGRIAASGPEMPIGYNTCEAPGRWQVKWFHTGYEQGVGRENPPRVLAWRRRIGCTYPPATGRVQRSLGAVRLVQTPREEIERKPTALACEVSEILHGARLANMSAETLGIG